MTGTWDAETYRGRAEKWRLEAAALPPGKEKDACILLAQGYAHLVALIERENEGRIGEDGLPQEQHLIYLQPGACSRRRD